MRPVDEIDYFHPCTMPRHCGKVLDLWIPIDMVMMWVEVLLSVGAQCH